MRGQGQQSGSRLKLETGPALRVPSEGILTVTFSSITRRTHVSRISSRFQVWSWRRKKKVFYRLQQARSRVPGLPIRHCARDCNNRVQICTQLSTIRVTAKTLFERLYLVLGLRKIALCVSCPCAPTTPTIQSTTISRFLCNVFPRMAPHFFCPWFTK